MIWGHTILFGKNLKLHLCLKVKRGEILSTLVDLRSKGAKPYARGNVAYGGGQQMEKEWEEQRMYNGDNGYLQRMENGEDREWQRRKKEI